VTTSDIHGAAPRCSFISTAGEVFTWLDVRVFLEALAANEAENRREPPEIGQLGIEQIPTLLHIRSPKAALNFVAVDAMGRGPSSLVSQYCARQHNPDLGELAGLRVDLDRAAVLLDDNVMTDRKAKSCALSRRFGGEEWIKHLFLHVGRNACTIISNPDLHLLAKVLGASLFTHLVYSAIVWRGTAS
jgi:hypothetical protein